MKLHTNSVTANDCPRFFTDHPTEETHAIVADDEWGDKVVLYLCLSGVTSYLPVCLLNSNVSVEKLNVTLLTMNLIRPGHRWMGGIYKILSAGF